MERFFSIIAKPWDIGECSLFNRLVFRTQLNGVHANFHILAWIGGYIAVLINVIAVLVMLVFASSNFMRVFLKHRERAAGVNRRGIGVNIFLAIPLLHDPAIEFVAIRGSHACLGHCLCVVHVNIAVFWSRIRAGSGIGIGQVVSHVDAISPVEHLAPLGIQVKFLGNPEAIPTLETNCI